MILSPVLRMAARTKRILVRGIIMEKLRNTCLFLCVALFTMLAVPRISASFFYLAEAVNLNFIFWVLVTVGIGAGAVMLGYKERKRRNSFVY